MHVTLVFLIFKKKGLVRPPNFSKIEKQNIGLAFQREYLLKVMDRITISRNSYNIYNCPLSSLSSQKSKAVQTTSSGT